jgi:chromosome segregation ATPase
VVSKAIESYGSYPDRPSLNELVAPIAQAITEAVEGVERERETWQGRALKSAEDAVESARDFNRAEKKITALEAQLQEAQATAYREALEELTAETEQLLYHFRHHDRAMARHAERVLNPKIEAARTALGDGS